MSVIAAWKASSRVPALAEGKLTAAISRNFLTALASICYEYCFMSGARPGGPAEAVVAGDREWATWSY
jgi:hypothetical protein